MADPEEEEGGEGGEGQEEEPKGEPPTTLLVMIKQLRNIPEASSTKVSYRYPLRRRPEGEEEGGDEEDEEGAFLAAASEEFEEPPSGNANEYGLQTDHALPAVSEEVLFQLITHPLEIKVEGLIAPGKVTIPLTDLVWKKDPAPTDPDEPKFLPGAPGAIVRGWYKVVLDGDMPEEEEPPPPAEGEEPRERQTFPPEAEVFVWLELSKLLVPKEELHALNVVTVAVRGVHRLPERLCPKEDETEEDHLYDYAIEYLVPGPLPTEAGGGDGGEEGSTKESAPEEEEAEGTPKEPPPPKGFVRIIVEPGTIVAAEAVPETSEEEEGEGGERGEEAEGEGEGGEAKAPDAAAEESDFPVKIQRSKEPASGLAKRRLTLLAAERSKEPASGLAERKAARITFEHTYKACMRGEAAALLRATIEERGFRVGLRRRLKSGDDYVYACKYHGTASPDLSELLKHDARECTVRCLVTSADDYALPTEEELEATPPPEGEPEEEEGGSPYVSAKTYLLMEMSTLKPLNPKPIPPKPPLPKVGDLVPTRSPAGADKLPKSAYDNLADEVRVVVEELADEYADLFMGDSARPMSPGGSDKRRKQAIFHLNQTGKYYEFKERMAAAVSRILRESYQNQSSADASTPEGQRFLSDLYSDLQVRLNVSLNAIFNPPAKTKQGAEAYTEAQLAKVLAEELRLAEEAELNRDDALAATHLNQRVLLSPPDQTLWHDYGTWCVRFGNWPKAEECLREALALDPRHVPSLTAYATLLCLMDNWGAAETYLRGAVECAPENLEAWSLLVLYYDSEARDMDRRAALKRVLEIHEASAGEEGAGGGGLVRESPYLVAGRRALALGASPLALRGASQEAAKRGVTQETRLMTARAYLASGDHEQCREVLQAALVEDRRLAVAMSLMAHSHYMEAGWPSYRCDIPMPPAEEAIGWFVKAQEARKPYTDALQCLRLGKLLLATGKWYEAKETFLRACSEAPSATTWLGLGIACLQRDEVSQAEEAFAEGNILDPKNPQLWGMLVVSCMRLSKPREAEDAFAQAQSLGLSTTETFPAGSFILEQIGDAFRGVGAYNLAAQAYRRGLSLKSPSPSLCQALAQTCVATNDLPEAVKTYSLVIDSQQASEDQRADALRECIALSARLRKADDVHKFENLLGSMGRQ